MMNCSTHHPHSAARCIKIGVLVVAGVAALTGVVMALWNCLLPDLFTGVSPIGYWQALGVLALSRILFGGLRGGGHGRWHGRHAHWESLSPDERAQLKGRFHRRWGCCSTPQTPDTPARADAAGDAPIDAR